MSISLDGKSASSAGIEPCRSGPVNQRTCITREIAHNRLRSSTHVKRSLHEATWRAAYLGLRPIFLIAACGKHL